MFEPGFENNEHALRWWKLLDIDIYLKDGARGRI